MVARTFLTVTLYTVIVHCRSCFYTSCSEKRSPCDKHYASCSRDDRTHSAVFIYDVDSYSNIDRL